MGFEQISILVAEDSIEKFKLILNIFRKRNPGFISSAFKFGKVKKDFLITFKFTPRFKSHLIEILTYNDFSIFMPDDKTKELINGVKEEIKKRLRLTQTFPTTRTDKVNKEDIGRYIKEGNYHAIINVTKDVSLDKKIVEMAKASMTYVIKKAIDIHIEKADKEYEEVKPAIKSLLKIAYDPKLKAMNRLDMMKEAGIHAIELCCIDPDFYDYLIDIINNNKVHNYVNAIAAARFADYVLENPQKFKKEISNAMKSINIRWLAIAVDIVYTDLHTTDINSINKLIDYIRANR